MDVTLFFLKELSSVMRLLCLILTLSLSSVPIRARETPHAKNVILLIGDGLGAAQIAFGIHYANMVEGRKLYLESLMNDGNTGYSMPTPYLSTVIDSAAAASQMATGRKSRNETLGLSSDGYVVETILEASKRRGLATGLVSNMRLSHATPAAFAAHQVSRYGPESEILDDVLTGYDVDVLLGGGARALVPSGRRVSEFLPGIVDELDGGSNRQDEVNRIAEAKAKGYVVVSDRTGLAEASPKADKLLGLFAASHLPYVVDTRAMGLESVPSLKDMVSAALDVLSRAGTGFFLMVEGGRIDYAGHDNDAGTMLHGIIDFDEALGAVLDFQSRHPDTLVIVTADHGTGGFSFTYADFNSRPAGLELPSGLGYAPRHRYPDRKQLVALGRQSGSYSYILDRAKGSPEGLVEAVRTHTGFEMTIQEAKEALVRDADGNAWVEDFRHFYGDQTSNPACLLGRRLSRHTFVAWATGNHTMEPVLTFGRGPGAEMLRGVYENTHVYAVAMKALEHYAVAR